MENKRVSVQMYMSANTRKKLRMLAVERDITINELLRDVLQKGFKSEGIDIDMSEGIEERGGYKGGPKDKREVSEN